MALRGQATEAIAVVQAFTAAWNAHDLVGVVALFAPDAVVRQRRGAVPPDVWDTRDPRVVREYLNDPFYDRDVTGLVWATGQPQIESWAAAEFAAHHRAAPGPYRHDGGTVSWPYHEYSDPFQRIPGVGPLDGTAEAVVRSGRITRLTLVLSPESAARRMGELDAALGQRLAVQRRAVASPLGAGWSHGPPGPSHGGAATADPGGLVWPAALGGLGVLAAVVAMRRRGRARRPAVHP